MRFSLLSTMLAMALMSVSATAREISFFDAEFSPDDWSAVITVIDDPTNPTPGPGTSTAVLSQAATGGNPGSYRLIQKNNRRGDVVVILDINVNQYDIASNGAIESVRFNFDASAAGAFDVNTPFAPILIQNGFAFFSLGELFRVDNDPAWQPFSSGELTASDFDANPLVLFGLGDPFNFTPDFSIGAAPIGFGYATIGQTAGSDPLVIVNGIDNFSAVFTSVVIPEPNSFLFVGGSLTVLARRRRSWL